MNHNSTPRYSGFEELLKRHQRLIRSLCWWYAGGDTEKTNDLVQDVMLQLWHYRHMLRPNATAAQERQWVRLHCRSVFQHQRRRTTIETVPLEETYEVAADNENYRELIDRLSVDLNDKEQQLLDLLLEGYTNSEMAQALLMSEKEVIALRKQTIDKLKNKANNIKS
ncbi:MAG: sigma-70 family RNA polymerase sigma factor [Bacteroidales bacterium]|nr:sigma-70 family RNA polymerase sigma factor [Bacteroidales bacterium]